MDTFLRDTFLATSAALNSPARLPAGPLRLPWATSSLLQSREARQITLRSRTLWANSGSISTTTTRKRTRPIAATRRLATSIKSLKRTSAGTSAHHGKTLAISSRLSLDRGKLITAFHREPEAWSCHCAMFSHPKVAVPSDRAAKTRTRPRCACPTSGA